MEIFSSACIFVLTLVGVTYGSPTSLEDDCSQCESMVASVNMMLSDTSRDRLLPAMCEALSIQDEMCSELSQLSPSELCQKLGYCAPRSIVYEPDSDFSLEMADNMQTSLPCVLCQNVMRIAHSFLSSKCHQKFLIHVMKSACHFVPFLTKQCVYFVDHYASMAIHLAAYYLSPATCKLLHICPAAQAVFGDECKMCQLGIGVIYDMVQDPALETRIEQFTNEICDEYVGDKKECESMAEDLAQLLLPMAEELRNSDFLKTACERADICTDDMLTSE